MEGDPNVAAAALDAIAGVVKASQNDNCPDLKQHFNNAQFQFAPTNTAATKRQEGDHYEVSHEGKTYETHMHLKRGRFRIYFSLGAKIAVIGAIGDHLPTAGYDD